MYSRRRGTAPRRRESDRALRRRGSGHRLELGEQGVGGGGIEAGSLQQPGEVGPRVGRTAGGEQAEGVPGLRHGVPLDELLTQDRGEGPLGEAEGLAELTVDSGGVSDIGAPFSTVDRLLSIVAMSTGPCLYVFEEISDTADDRVVGAPDLPALLAGDGRRAAWGGFEDIGPSAGNVFPFVGPEGITVSEWRSSPTCGSRRWHRRSSSWSWRATSREAKPDGSAVAAGVPHRAGQVRSTGDARAAARVEERWAALTSPRGARGASKVAAAAPRRASARSSE